MRANVSWSMLQRHERADASRTEYVVKCEEFERGDISSNSERKGDRSHESQSTAQTAADGVRSTGIDALIHTAAETATATWTGREEDGDFDIFVDVDVKFDFNSTFDGDDADADDSGVVGDLDAMDESSMASISISSAAVVVMSSAASIGGSSLSASEPALPKQKFFVEISMTLHAAMRTEESTSRRKHSEQTSTILGIHSLKKERKKKKEKLTKAEKGSR